MRALLKPWILFLATIKTIKSLPTLNITDNILTLNTSDSNYLISDCDARTPLVVHALDLATSALPRAIANAQLGTPSIYGFTAFFKQQSSASALASTLQDIHSQKALRGRWPNPLRASPPQFICVKPDTKTRYRGLNFNPYLACKRPNMYAFYGRMSRYIFLCDFFFERPITPTAPSTETCIKVRNNSFQGFGNLLCLYQKYMLIHEMVHFYLGKNGLGLSTKPLEKYALNDAVQFDGRLSLRNPQNYQAFVAMVDQGCTEAPDPFRSPFWVDAVENGSPNAMASWSQDGDADQARYLPGTSSSRNGNFDVDIA